MRRSRESSVFCASMPVFTVFSICVILAIFLRILASFTAPAFSSGKVALLQGPKQRCQRSYSMSSRTRRGYQSLHSSGGLLFGPMPNTSHLPSGVRAQ